MVKKATIGNIANKMWTIPNIITLLRVVLIPVFVAIYFLDWKWAHEAGALVFALAVNYKSVEIKASCQNLSTSLKKQTHALHTKKYSD